MWFISDLDYRLCTFTNISTTLWVQSWWAMILPVGEEKVWILLVYSNVSGGIRTDLRGSLHGPAFGQYVTTDKAPKSSVSNVSSPRRPSRTHARTHWCRACCSSPHFYWLPYLPTLYNRTSSVVWKHQLLMPRTVSLFGHRERLRLRENTHISCHDLSMRHVFRTLCRVGILRL
jgi:hypothetical protein